MEDDEYERKPLYYDPPYRPIGRECGRCTHWHALTHEQGLSDYDTICGTLAGNCDGARKVAHRLCGVLGICGHMVDLAETYDEPQKLYLTAWSDDALEWCDFIDRAEVDG